MLCVDFFSESNAFSELYTIFREIYSSLQINATLFFDKPSAEDDVIIKSNHVDIHFIWFMNVL